ncbi:hypothetical protein JW890_08685, partial [candidate division WOR-3 bacterium]|nr:hypothetical protein [candidate division WOR-3 bacterium]
MTYRKNLPLYGLLLGLLVTVTFLMFWSSMMLMKNGEKAILSMTEKELLALSSAYSQSIQQLYSSGQVKDNLLKLFTLSAAHMIARRPDVSGEELRIIAL